MNTVPLTSRPAGWPAYRLNGFDLERWDDGIGRYVSFNRRDAEFFRMQHEIERAAGEASGQERRAVRNHLAADELCEVLEQHSIRMRAGNVVFLSDYKKGLGGE